VSKIADWLLQSCSRTIQLLLDWLTPVATAGSTKWVRHMFDEKWKAEKLATLTLRFFKKPWFDWVKRYVVAHRFIVFKIQKCVL